VDSKIIQKLISNTLGSEVVIRIVRSTLSKLLQTSSSVFPSIDRSCPFGSVCFGGGNRKNKGSSMLPTLIKNLPKKNA